jgi:hypothetical protein
MHRRHKKIMPPMDVSIQIKKTGVKEMSKKKFGKLIKFKGRHYRYNAEQALLEWVTTENYDWNEDKTDLVKVEMEVPEVIDSIGLSRENAEADLMGYIEGWHYDIEEELAYMM